MPQSPSVRTSTDEGFTGHAAAGADGVVRPRDGAVKLLRAARSPTGLLVLVTLLAVLLQASRLPMRWNQISFAYAAYFGEYMWFVGENGWHTALTRFVGVHPPAYSLLFAAMAKAGASPLVWHGVSGLLSVAAVPVLAVAARRSLRGHEAVGTVVVGTALLIAVSPHRNAYGLEVNNYPLLLFATCLQLLAFAHFVGSHREECTKARSTRSALWLVLSTALALWTHGLALALPVSQLLTLAALPGGRVLLRPFVKTLMITALLCLPLLPGLLAIASGDGINEAKGPSAAWQSLAEVLPGRYGSATAGWAVAAMAGLGVTRIMALPAGDRLLPLSWLVHLMVSSAMIVLLISLGVASAVQLPYYLAPLPALLLLAACSLLPGPPDNRTPEQLGLLFRLVTPQRALVGVLTLALLVNTGMLISDWHGATTTRSRAASDYPLVAEGIRHWQAGATLALIQFPQYLDDDKDAVDPIYPLLPIEERVWFDDPNVIHKTKGHMVPFDPFFGQPVRYADDRWLYTFTSVSTEHLDPLASKVFGDGKTLVVAAYGCSFSEAETRKLERWATGLGATGRQSGDEGLWLWPDGPGGTR